MRAWGEGEGAGYAVPLPKSSLGRVVTKEYALPRIHAGESENNVPSPKFPLGRAQKCSFFLGFPLEFY